MPDVILILADIRSTHNDGSLLRTSDGFGVKKVYLCGITPYPMHAEADKRLPHIAVKLDAQIHKTALGAEKTVPWEYREHLEEVIAELKIQGWQLCALEQDERSVPLTKFDVKSKTALIVGTEVTGLPRSILKECDKIVEIPMNGTKESFNVSVAAAIALFWFTR